MTRSYSMPTKKFSINRKTRSAPNQKIRSNNTNSKSKPKSRKTRSAPNQKIRSNNTNSKSKPKSRKTRSAPNQKIRSNNTNSKSKPKSRTRSRKIHSAPNAKRSLIKRRRRKAKSANNTPFSSKPRLVSKSTTKSSNFRPRRRPGAPSPRSSSSRRSFSSGLIGTTSSNPYAPPMESPRGINEFPRSSNSD